MIGMWFWFPRKKISAWHDFRDQVVLTLQHVFLDEINTDHILGMDISAKKVLMSHGMTRVVKVSGIGHTQFKWYIALKILRFTGVSNKSHRWLIFAHNIEPVLFVAKCVVRCDHTFCNKHAKYQMSQAKISN